MGVQHELNDYLQLLPCYCIHEKPITTLAAAYLYFLTEKFNCTTYSRCSLFLRQPIVMSTFHHLISVPHPSQLHKVAQLGMKLTCLNFCIFLGHEQWNEYVMHTKKLQKQKVQMRNSYLTSLCHMFELETIKSNSKPPWLSISLNQRIHTTSGLS